MFDSFAMNDVKQKPFSDMVVPRLLCAAAFKTFLASEFCYNYLHTVELNW